MAFCRCKNVTEKDVSVIEHLDTSAVSPMQEHRVDETKMGDSTKTQDLENCMCFREVSLKKLIISLHSI